VKIRITKHASQIETLSSSIDKSILRDEEAGSRALVLIVTHSQWGMAVVYSVMRMSLLNTKFVYDLEADEVRFGSIRIYKTIIHVFKSHRRLCFSNILEWNC
jgi:hypothetical protein